MNFDKKIFITICIFIILVASFKKNNIEHLDNNCNIPDNTCVYGGDGRTTHYAECKDGKVVSNCDGAGEDVCKQCKYCSWCIGSDYEGKCVATDEWNSGKCPNTYKKDKYCSDVGEDYKYCPAKDKKQMGYCVDKDAKC